MPVDIEVVTKISALPEISVPLAADVFPFSRAGGSYRMQQGNFLANAPATVFANKHVLLPGMSIGPAAGSVSGAPVQLLDVAYGHIRLIPVSPPAAPTIASIGAGGAVDTGTHYYKITFVTATGETELGAPSAAATTTGGNNTVNLSGLLAGVESTVTARKIYRSKVGGAQSTGPYYLVDTIPDNTTTTYIDTKADSALGAYDAQAMGNTTAGKMFLAGSSFADQCALISIENTAFGLHALASGATAGRNAAFGVYALQSVTTGEGNVGVGAHAGAGLTNGANNQAIGYYALYVNQSGIGNVAIGTQTLWSNVSGSNNIGIGAGVMVGNLQSSNIAIGANALYHNINGSGNVAVGFAAGFQETGSNKLLINNVAQASESDDHTKSLIYGVFDAAVSNQSLAFNAGSMGFFGHTAAARPAKASHNNWASISDVTAALAALGLVDVA